MNYAKQCENQNGRIPFAHERELKIECLFRSIFNLIGQKNMHSQNQTVGINIVDHDIDGVFAKQHS